MPSIGILTDSSAQFSQQGFPGSEFVRQIPLNIKQGISKSTSLGNISNFSSNSNFSNKPNLESPSTIEFIKYIREIKKEFNEIFIILISNQIIPAYDHALEAINYIGDKSRIQLIDSWSFSYGLGIIIKNIAFHIKNNESSRFIAQEVRRVIPKIYGAFCSPNHGYLHYPGFLDGAQANILEMLGLIPVFTLEEGQFNSLEKVRSIKNCYLIFEEFIDEFDNLEEINFIYGNPPRFREMRFLRNHCEESFPLTRYSNQLMNAVAATIIGPKAMGVFVRDNSSI
jgi:DegV family protein with EDD domain